VDTSSEIVLPVTEPETEWVRSRALQKVSPTYRHGRLQWLLCSIFTDWAEGRGRVAPEWRFRVNPSGEPVRPLVPDIAYLSYERLGRDRDAEAQTPLGTPDVATEIMSPGDREADVEDKIATYLRAGSQLVIVVDPQGEAIAMIDRTERRIFRTGETALHGAIPDLRIDVTRLFEDARR
jgi:Uma2 family endonuclease